MSLTNLVLVVLTVSTAIHGDNNNVVFEDSLHNIRADKQSLPESVTEAMGYYQPVYSPSDVYLQTLVLGLYNATLNVDRSLTSLNALDHESDRNVIVSPVSILATMALVFMGANGQTKTELGNLFGFNERTLSSSTNDGDKNFKKLGMLFNNYKENGGANATLAKAVFLPLNNRPLARQYWTALKEYLDSDVIYTDFKNNGLDSQQTINRWVSVHTQQRITEILQNTPSPDTRAMIASALFFSGEWEYPFFVNYTKSKPFYYELNGDTSKNKNLIYVNMMIGNSEVFYYKNDALKFTALGLPYKGGVYTAYFIVPHENSNLRSLMSTMNERTLKNVTESMTITEVTYFVPKMTLNSFTNLKPVLQNMEINSVFDPSKADLSKMGLGSDFFISDILHKVEIVVDEVGTVGSAATIATITRGGQPVFNVNRPFLFFIHHRLTDTILFWASINKPTPYFTTPQISQKKLQS